MRFSIIGCGLIGQKRLRALGAEHTLVAAADVNLERAEALARQSRGAVATADWRQAVERPDVDAVIVATTNDALAGIALAAIQAFKHVLVEKPAARHAGEILPLIAAAQAQKVCVQVGFNHRFHPAFQKAREIFESGVLGPLMFLRGRYGHGGRVGYDREWRADPALSGGGELLDQGVHLIDLARWFLGEFPRIDGFSHTYFWDMPVEDNGFLLLRTAQDQVAFLHVSCTEWKNLFSFEIYGRNGKLHIEGLGGSYGVERLSYYAMQPEMGPPPTTIWEYPGPDTSWKLETDRFAGFVARRETPTPGLADAHAALTVVAEIYRKSNP
ncbi:MAG: Gfo/Idh/MocA family oxidoreductase [Bryobacteraceae bacterium]